MAAPANGVRATPVHATLPQQLRIKELIEQHSDLTEEQDENGKFVRRLHSGWTCVRIAGEISLELRGNHVSKVANEFGWRFISKADGNSNKLAAAPELEGRVAKLEKLLSTGQKCESCQAVEDHANALEKRLSVVELRVAQVQGEVERLPAGKQHRAVVHLNSRMTTVESRLESLEEAQ